MAEPELRAEISRLETLFGIDLSVAERAALPPYLALLQRWNRRLNLTADSSPRLVLRRHIFEALWAARRFLADVVSLADIGSGAGFPGLFLALAAPRCRVVLIERQAKRVAFLQEAVRLLDPAPSVFEGGAADFEGWGAIHLASARAVRLDPSVLGPLEACSVPLLWFHTLATAPPGAPWRRAESLAVPGSEQSRVTRLVAAGD